jgi:VCBS repeat-containing protein
MEQLFGDMFGQHMAPQGPQMASGSGVIISPDGYIVTNNHVVEKATKIEVTTNNHHYYTAKVIGTDPNTDLALVKIDGHDLPIVKFGNSDAVKVGEWVLAVGNPFRLRSTVTAGIISAKGRNIGIIGSEDQGQDEMTPFGRMHMQRQGGQPKLNSAIESFIQTDAAINPGNSGGALVNARGELIGINSAIASQTGSYEGYGFAIPINLARKVLNDIEKYGAVKRGYLGVSFSALDEDAAQSLHISQTTGLYINDVASGSGAEAAGLKHGDIITKVNGKTVYESSDLQEAVARLAPGDKIDLTVLHDGSSRNVSVTLKSDAGNLGRRTAMNKSATELYNRLGASFRGLSSADKAKYHTDHGVVVGQVRNGGMFDAYGIPSGTVITSINGQSVNNSDDVSSALANGKNNMIVIKGIGPDGTRFTDSFSVGE